MKIDSIKDLTKLVQLCRKTGVLSIKVDGIELTLGAEPLKKAYKPTSYSIPSATSNTAYGEIDEDTKILTDELTPEQLLFYSAQGHEPTEELS